MSPRAACRLEALGFADVYDWLCASQAALPCTCVVLGRLRSGAIGAPRDARAEDVMEPGPSTVRPDLPASALAKRLAERDLKTAIVTNPEGELIGVVRREDLERAG